MDCYYIIRFFANTVELIVSFYGTKHHVLYCKINFFFLFYGKLPIIWSTATMF